MTRPIHFTPRGGEGKYPSLMSSPHFKEFMLGILYDEKPLIVDRSEPTLTSTIATEVRTDVGLQIAPRYLVR